MVKSLKNLGKILKSDLGTLKYLAGNASRFYYQQEQIKIDKNGEIVLDKNNKPELRIITPSKGELKRVQGLIKGLLLKFSIPSYIHGGVRKKSNISNAKEHLGKNYNFVVDIKSFFPSITNKQVYCTFIKLGFSPNVARLLTQLTTYKGSLPQGTSTSTILANIVYLENDFSIFEFSKRRDISYTRFVDDFTFSSSLDFKSDTSNLVSLISNNGFKPHRGKTGYKKGPIEITGVYKKNNSLNVPKYIYRRLSKKELNDFQRNGLVNYIHQIHMH